MPFIAILSFFSEFALIAARLPTPLLRSHPARPYQRPAGRPAGDAVDTLLEVENLRVRFPTPTGVVKAVRGVSFAVGAEKVGIVGESGSGKSTVGRALLRLIPRPGIVEADRLALAGPHPLRAPGGRPRAPPRAR